MFTRSSKKVLKNPSGYEKKKLSVRRLKITERNRRSILRTASGIGDSSSQIVNDLKLNVSFRTVRRILQRAPNMKWKNMKVKPKLEPLHLKARLYFAQQHMSWTTEWSTATWSDENKFNLDGPDGVRYYWHDIRHEKQHIFSRNFGGRSVMTWAGFSQNGKIALDFLNGKQKEDAD